MRAPAAVTAFAPASVGNVAVGFDLLGLALQGPGDRVTVRRSPRPGVRIRAVRGIPCAVPADPARNTAGRALLSLVQALAAPMEGGLELEIDKGIPLGSGMGGSAASAVAAALAGAALLGAGTSPRELLPHALAGEALASGGAAHADNVAPALFGGLTLALPARPGEAPPVVQLDVPEGVDCVLVHPHLSVETAAGRAVLRSSYALAELTMQGGLLAGFVAGCCRGDLELIAATLEDRLIEPQRQHLVPGFAGARAAALDSGALGCSISGSGPSLFAWTRREAAMRVAAAMQTAFAAEGIASDRWISPLDTPGARIEQRLEAA